MSTRTYLYGLDLLRVVASVLVLFTHIANWFSTRQREWWLAGWVHRDVVTPLHLNDNLSFAGVSLFLLISGLVVTHVADRERPRQFLRRRLARVLPLLFVASVIAWLLVNHAGYRPESGQSSLDLLDLLAGMTLAGFFTTPEVVFLGIAWTLLTQIVFYGYVAATMPLLRRHAWAPSALAAALCCVLLSLATGVGTVAAHRIGMIAAFFPVLCLGQLLSLVHARKVRPGAGVVLGAVHVLLFVWADRLGEYMLGGTAYPRTLLIMLALVALVMTVHGRLSRSRVVRTWSRRTYAIYLLHPLCLYPVLDRLAPVIGADVALLVALGLLAAVVEPAHRLVELPVNNWFRSREGVRSISFPRRRTRLRR
ncbi:acyltransferase family protein [Prauserella oleivorans]|uniref:Acyltransferase family protein n=1 Tax=Prauserella oleivorans TaxID=1478153 RepID=A0ABW5WH27_9PSEU